MSPALNNLLLCLPPPNPFIFKLDALLTAFTYQMTVGFALGYAYMRTRNVLPLSLIHTLIDSAF